jgi:hypothetical protein
MLHNFLKKRMKHLQCKFQVKIIVPQNQKIHTIAQLQKWIKKNKAIKKNRDIHLLDLRINK